MTGKIAGFQTEQGSIYSYDADGRTVRLKLSQGRRHGEFHVSSMCLFVPSEAMPQIEKHYHGLGHHENRLALGHAKPGESFTQFGNTMNVPTGEQPFVIIMERATKKVIVGGAASLVPQIGHYPIEKAYDEKKGESHTHVGNRVTKIFDSPAELAQAIANALQPQISAENRPLRRPPLREEKPKPR